MARPKASLTSANAAGVASGRGTDVSLDRTFYCDGPDCDRHVRTMKLSPPMFLTVTEHETRDHVSHFCGWDCVLRHAATKEPAEVVLIDPGEDAA